VVGWKRLPRFDADAFTEIHRASQGNPLRINALSHQVVLSRYLNSQVHVDGAAVEEAIVALQEAERHAQVQVEARAAEAQQAQTSASAPKEAAPGAPTPASVGPAGTDTSLGTAAAAASSQVGTAAASSDASISAIASAAAATAASATTAPLAGPQDAGSALPAEGATDPLVADIPIEPITPLAAAAAAAASRDAARRRALHQDRPISIGELPVLTQAVRKGRNAPAAESASSADTQPLVPPLSGKGSGRPLLCVVGGQADHIKAAALWRALAGRTDLPVMLMVRAYANNAYARHSALFDGLDVAGRLVNLGIGGVASAARAAELTQRFEFVLDQCQPGAVIVFDGSDAALSCGLVAQRKSVPVVQIGAGLRGPGQQGAADLTRKLTDELSDVLYTADAQAGERLSREGIALDRVSFAGNLLIDSLQHALRDPPPEGTPPELAGVPPELLTDRNGYAVVVLHSQANLADRTTLADLIAMLRGISHDMPLIWPMHSRAREQLSKFRLDATLAGERIVCLPSMAYARYAQLLSHATCVITDSWNVQEEATALGIPCVSVGLESECPITSALGSNTYVGMSKAQATRAVWHCIFNGGKRGEVPELWDGQTGPRIAEHLSLWLREVTTVKAALGAYATAS
jgi:UDP-N-acetylglucosamine 2-epimerase (non-hydrolysing)